LLAARVLHRGEPAAVEVTLRRPPPLEVAMQVQHAEAATLLTDGELRIAEARVVDLDLHHVEPVGGDEAKAAEAGFPGLRDHPFPTCFTCGTARAEGDGLRIFPGPVHDRMAALWTPHPNLREHPGDLPEEPARVGLETAWAALDCVGGWAGDMAGRKMVLGRITAQVDALPTVGEPHVVVGASLGQEGRKTFTASALYDRHGRIVARAQHVWIAIDPADFN
ncbi:MAG: hypothetical protein ACRDXB_14460, partial [Actinomycetes bacterium]